MTLNLALIGTGGIVRNGHAVALAAAPSVQLWSVLSRDLARAESFAREFGAGAPKPAHDRLESLLADPELDGVIIATPDKLHSAQALAAARAGKHILLEKPMATDLEEARALLDQCQRRQVTLGLCYHLRWHSGHRVVVAGAHQGEFGELKHVRAMWSYRAPDAANWRAGSRLGRWWSLAAVGTHCLDLARWTLTPACGEITEFRALTSKAHWQGPHDESALLTGRFQSGATMEICSSVLFEAPPRFEIYGTKGYAICQGTLGREGGGQIWTHRGDVQFRVENPFVGLVEDFARAVKEGRQPAVSGDEALRNLEFLLKADPH